MILLYIILALASVYGIIWACLLTGYWQSQRRAVAAFLTSWESGDYITRLSSGGSDPSLRITFGGSEEEKRYVEVNKNGSLITEIRWESGGRSGTKPNNSTRAALEDITQQIVTMYKLENGDFEDNTGDDYGF